MNVENIDEINLKNLARSFWKSKYFILFISLVFFVFAIFYALSLPNIYKSEATLIDPSASSSRQSDFAAIADRYSGLANMAGISIGGGQSSQTDLVLAILKSRDFFNKYYENKDLLKDLIYFKEYDHVNKKNIYISSNIFDDSFDNSFKLFHEHFSSSKDIKSNLVTLTFEHQSPSIAKKWLDKIIFDINKYVKDKEVEKATATYDILANEIVSINNPDLNFMISKLAEKQIQTITLSKVTNEFAFQVIDSPYLPEKKFKPYRTWVVVLITIIGFIISSFLVLITYYLGFYILIKANPPFITFLKNRY